MDKDNYGSAVAVFLLGLFPAFFLPTLQLMIIVMLVGLAVSFRKFDRKAFKSLLNWRYVACLQFCMVFFLNALIYPVWEGTPEHFRTVALESWGGSFICVIVLGLWLSIQKNTDLKRVLILWFPAGLTATFLVATVIYFSGSQGVRVRIFTPSELVPPFWFLVLTMTSFVWFFEMSRAHKFWRITLFFLAGVMTIYGGARLVLLAWLICGAGLVLWAYYQSSPRDRMRVLLSAGLCAGVCAGGLLIVDLFLGGILLSRMMVFIKVGFDYENINTYFLRLQLWSGALSIFAENSLFGVGQVNERIALRLELDWERWLRAHQTYLSYLIAGGIPALLSGVLMQSPVLAFVGSVRRVAFLPAFLGLGVVVTLNCLTDSIFQSAVNVQAFMLMTLVFLKVKNV